MSSIVPPVNLKSNVPGLLPTFNTNSCGVGEYPPVYNASQPVPCVIGITSMSISNKQRTVGVGVNVGVGVGSAVADGVMLGVMVGVVVTVGFGV